MTTNDQQWLPNIIPSLCIGCKQCVEACPVDALAQVKGKAQLTQPKNCIYCLACEDICPESAIELPFLIITQSKITGETK